MPPEARRHIVTILALFAALAVLLGIAARDGDREREAGGSLWYSADRYRK